MIKYFSMFSGIGGFELGIKRALYDLRSAEKYEHEKKDCERKGKGRMGTDKTNGLVCVGFSEIDKYAIQVYKKHFPEHENYGNATEINPEKLPDFDLLVGGFPCQAFSIAGKRRGFEDTRGTLFFEIARILKRKQPRLFLLENVKGLLNHDKGETFTTILQTIDELGYDAQWEVLNSKHFGVPQNRERVFIVGHLRGTSRPEVFPIRESNRENNGRVGEGVSYCIDSNYYKGTNTLKKGRRQLIKVYDDYNSKFRKDGNTCTLTQKSGSKSERTGQKIVIGLTIRRLTTIECERLQGFPDNWTAEGTEGKISDTQRYKMCGNAVTVNVIESIMEKLLLRTK